MSINTPFPPPDLSREIGPELPVAILSSTDTLSASDLAVNMSEVQHTEPQITTPENIEDQETLHSLKSIVAVGAIATGAYIAHKLGVTTESSGALLGGGIPLLNRSRRFQIAQLGSKSGRKAGRAVSRTSSDRIDQIRKIHYDRVTPDISAIPTLEVSRDVYDQEGNHMGTTTEIVANGGARGVERLLARRGVARTTSSVRVDQLNKAGKNITKGLSPTETVASSGKEKRLERRLARANGKIAFFDKEIESFTMLYGTALLDSHALSDYISRTPMSRGERRDLLDAAVKARHAEHAKHTLLEKHYKGLFDHAGHGDEHDDAHSPTNHVLNINQPPTGARVETPEDLKAMKLGLVNGQIKIKMIDGGPDVTDGKIVAYQYNHNPDKRGTPYLVEFTDRNGNKQQAWLSPAKLRFWNPPKTPDQNHGTQANQQNNAPHVESPADQQATRMGLRNGEIRVRMLDGGADIPDGRLVNYTYTDPANPDSIHYLVEFTGRNGNNQQTWVDPTKLRFWNPPKP